MIQTGFNLGCKKVGGTASTVFTVAEIGINHGGNCSQAKKLIDAAAECGADAVKFQTFRADRLLIANRDRYDQQVEKSESAFEMFRRCELSLDDHKELKSHAEAQGILFFSTPFDEDSVDRLDALGVPAFKIASSDITHLPLLRRVAGKGKPILLSTGSSYLEEVSAAVGLLQQEGAGNIMLLHCVSAYPAPINSLNLRAISTLRQHFNLPVGYSDHSQGILAALLAVALGAVLIEKHFTLDRDAPGPDHKLSMDPFELRNLVQHLRIVEKSLGSGLKCPANSELRARELGRRSIVAAVDIRAGRRIQHEMLTLKRPGVGLPPADLERVVGMIARQDIAADTLLHLEHLSMPVTFEPSSVNSGEMRHFTSDAPIILVSKDPSHG